MKPLSKTLLPGTSLAVLVVLGTSHLLNDLIQSLIPAVYPLLKQTYALDFAQIGLITLTFQVAGALLQPVVGVITDKHPAPYTPVVGMMFSLAGLVSLAFAHSYVVILLSVGLIGIGSSIFHPEATRMARYAAGPRQGLAQGIFQVGGQSGNAMGPFFAALVIVPWGQPSLAFFAVLALIAMGLLTWMAGQQKALRHAFPSTHTPAAHGADPESHRRGVRVGMTVLVLLMLGKVTYQECFRSFYTFFLMEKFQLSIPHAQLMLFLLLIASAVGVLLGGLLGDKIGRYRIIWISVLGPLPLTLILPYADLFWTGALTVLINLIMASAFASILIYAMDLLPHRVGLIGGLFYGLNFAFGGLAAALLGGLADAYGVERVYQIVSILPLAGLLAWFLPREKKPAGR